jgi:hypothetical protein
MKQYNMFIRRAKSYYGFILRPRDNNGMNMQEPDLKWKSVLKMQERLRTVRFLSRTWFHFPGA